MSQLKVNVAVDGSKVASGLAKSKQEVAQWASSVKSAVAGAFSGAAVGAAIKQTMDSIDSLGNASDRMGRTISEVQMLAQIAQLAGRELGNVEKMLNNIAEAQVAALSGDESKMNFFQKMGFNRESLSQTNELGVAQQMAKATVGKSGAEMRGMGISEIVGKKNVGDFVAMQNDFINFLDNISAKLKDGSLLNDKDVIAFNKAKDQFDIALTGLKNNITSTFMPLATTIIDIFNGLFSKLDDLRKKYPKLVSASEMVSVATGGTLSKLAALARMHQDNKPEDKDVTGSLNEMLLGSASGPGNVTNPNTKTKEQFLQKLDTPDKFSPTLPTSIADSYISRGGFKGTSMDMVQHVSHETNRLLKLIEKNTRERGIIQAHNLSMEAIGAAFGIPVK